MKILIAVIEKLQQCFRKEDAGETTIPREHAPASEPIEFSSISPYEILGIAPTIKPEEIEAAYERQLSRHYQIERKMHQKLTLLHQAYEAIKRKNDDKYLAAG